LDSAALSWIEARGTRFDQLKWARVTFTLANGERRTVFFDISEFFGKF